jgi:Chaperone of endosialidase
LVDYELHAPILRLGAGSGAVSDYKKVYFFERVPISEPRRNEVISKYRGRWVCLLTFLPLLLTAQRAPENVIPLKNWASPLNWHPNQVESAAIAQALPRNASAPAAPQLQFPGNVVSADALTFVAITPCRLVDTRGAAAGFNGIAPFSGPSIAGSGTVTFPVQSYSEATANTAPAPCGSISSIAEAYSFNVTVIPHARDAANYVTLWPAGSPQPVVSTLDDSQGLIVANAAIVPAGEAGGVSLYSSGPATIDVIIDMNGYFTPPTDLIGNTAIGVGTLAANNGGYDNTATGGQALASNTAGGYNTASGFDALQFNTTGTYNTATGLSALQANTTGTQNTATGLSALQDNTTGSYNTATGLYTLVHNTTGGYNTAGGYYTMFDNQTGSNNTALGSSAMNYSTTGSNNTAIGYNALYNNTIGGFNIALGNGAGSNAPSINSNSIFIGSQGTGTDINGTIEIGIPGTQTSFFAAGITAVTTGLGDAVAVVIDSNGQLGTIVSSGRFKEDIQDMGDASNALLRLRPVTYRYKQPYKNGSKPVDYGLIAEEVADVYPDLVVKGKDGQIQTVQYQKLTPMLLNEVQKQAGQIRRLVEQNEQQAGQIRSLEEKIPFQGPLSILSNGTAGYNMHAVPTCVPGYIPRVDEKEI